MSASQTNSAGSLGVDPVRSTPPPAYGKITICIALVCMVILGLDTWRSWTARTTLITAAQVATSNLARSLAQHAHDMLSTADTLLVSLREDVEAEGLGELRRDHLRRLAASEISTLPMMRDLMVFDAQGYRLINSGRPAPAIENVSDREYFQYHAAHTDRAVHFGNPVHGKLDGTWIITLSRRIDDPVGKFEGVVVSTFSVGSIGSFYETFDVGKKGFLGLYTLDGVIITRQPGKETQTGHQVPRGGLYMNQVRVSPIGDWHSVSLIDGVDHLGSYRTVQGFPLFVVAGRGVDELLKPWWTDALVHLAISLCTSAILIFLGIRFIRQLRLQHQAKKDAQRSEFHYRLLADTTSDVITQLDLNLIPRYVSPSCRSILGYEPEDMLGIAPSAFTHPEDAASARETMEFLAGGAVPGDKSTVTNRMRHKDGHWIWLEAGINLVRDPHTGAPASLVCSLRDVTERQRTARHLERATAVAENATRIKADFVANMSHELRTPLTGILGVHALLKSDPQLTSRQKHYLDIAAKAGLSLLTIVNDVLDFSKIEAGQLSIDMVPFDLKELLTACCDVAVFEAQRKSLRMEAHIEEVGRPLVGDPDRLRQIVLNLLTNAIKFTERGEVIVRSRYDAETARLHVEVADTGIGIADENIAKMFERFNQGDSSITRRYGGTGLGLAICKRLVELMGGEIGMTSELGKGSIFWFDIPLAASDQMAEHLPYDANHDGSRPRRALLAEDNLVNQEIIIAMLENRGHEVTAVGTGAAAVEAAQAQTFDIILMDVQMPVMDGLSASRAIRIFEKTRGRAPTPIIGLTANALTEDIDRCHEAGMDAHVAKPIDWAQLFATMDRLDIGSSPARQEGMPMAAGR